MICSDLNCPICTATPGAIPAVLWSYQTMPDPPKQEAVVDFVFGASDFTHLNDWWEEQYAAMRAEEEAADVAAELKAAEEYEQFVRDNPETYRSCCGDCERYCDSLRAAVLDLTMAVEYLLVWTGKKGNKTDRDRYLDGYIDPIRAIL